jgi:NAD-dependent protein deacetylase/lipoamidase
MTETDVLSQVRSWIDASDRVVVLTGAGISTDSGIPDFRGPNGVWTKNPAAEKQATIQHYLAEPEVRRAAWRNRLSSPAWSASPNAGHDALVTLERRGKLHALVTQNVDGLHQLAGVAADLVVEVHGTIHRYACWDCGDEGPMTRVLERIVAGEEDPPCRTCGGILKSATISFGQSLVPEVIVRAMTVAEEADLLLAIGTSLQVYPVANMVPLAKLAGARVVIVNAEPTPFDRDADAVLRGSISEVLPALVGTR